MRIRLWLIILTCWSGMHIYSGSSAQNIRKDRPNIIFIMTDDQAIRTISAYGYDLMKTPNIDRIAKEGALLNNAFVTNSLCGPSRAVILTGKYSHINGFKKNHEHFNSDQQTFPKILRQHGYKTAIVGKWHLHSTPTGFDYWNILPGQGNYYNPDFIKMGKDTLYKGYVTDIITDLALKWLDSNKRHPFLLMIHEKAPHGNRMPPLENLDLFNDRIFKLPPTFFDDYKGRPALQRNKLRMADNLAIDFDSKVPCDSCTGYKLKKLSPKKYKRVMKRLTPEQRKVWEKAYQKEYTGFSKIKTKEELVKWQFQRFMEDYLRCIKSVDDNVGRILKYLDDNGLAKNTVVIFTSDQGFFLGEHGLYNKEFMYEEAFRTPMMIRYPKKIRGGEKLNQFVLNLDLAPTLLDYAGITIPGDMQGRSMKGILSGKDIKNWRDKIYYHYYEETYGVSAHYGIRTKRYKLIHFYHPIDSWELYDLKKDPHEMKNLYSDPTYAKRVDKLKAELKDLALKYKDEVVYKELNIK